jgi:hypothetical protein
MTYLQVPQLGKLLSTVIQSASEWFDLLVDDLVCTDIATLGKCFAADIAAVRALSGMAPLMRLETELASVCMHISTIHTFRLPSWENLCPQPGALHSKGFAPV